LKEEAFASLQMPLPPVEEQRRIVARVDAIASRTTEARRLREEANAEVTACFVSERSLCFRTSATGRTVPLSEGAHLERGRFLHRPRNEPRFFGGPHPWIQIGEVEAAKKYISRYTTTLNDLGLAISRKFPSGTLLVSIAATIGAVGILGFDCCVPDSIVAVQPKEGVDTEYLFHWIGYARSDLERLAPQSAQKNINLQILSELPLPLPPLDEQRRIVEHLDALEAKLDAVRAEQQASAAELDALLPSVLNRAFAGQL
jgi:type I restriction enzyme S subunit